MLEEKGKGKQEGKCEKEVLKGGEMGCIAGRKVGKKAWSIQ
jgi:hypothetical protein